MVLFQQKCYFYQPLSLWKWGHGVLHLPVCLSVCRSVDLYTKRCFINSFAWKLPNLEQPVPLESRCFGLFSNVVRSIFLKPFNEKLVQWIPLSNRWPLLIFKLHGQRSRTNCWSLKNVFCSIYINFFYGKFSNLVQWMTLESRWPLFIFRSFV